MPPSGSITGVSGGGGEPLVARVVDVEAVELYRLTVLGIGACSMLFDGSGPFELDADGGG